MFGRRPRKVWAILLTGLLLAGSLAAGAAFAARRHGDRSAADGPVLELSSRRLKPGAPLTIAGHACPGASAEESDGPWQVEVWLVPAVPLPGTEVSADPAVVVAPDDDGDWAARLAAPVTPGEYRLEAGCFDDRVPPAGFVYRHETVVVR